MNIPELQQLCKALPGMTEDIKWENHLCFNVGGKMFLVTSPDNVPHRRLSSGGRLSRANSLNRS